jgi:hypothetical protein
LDEDQQQHEDDDGNKDSWAQLQEQAKAVQAREELVGAPFYQLVKAIDVCAAISLNL